MTRRKPALRGGFGLIELLVALAVLGFLLALLLPLLQRLRAEAARQRSVNDLKQMALAAHGCNDTWKKLPPAFGRFGQLQTALSVHVHLLPYLEQTPLYNLYVRGEGPDLDRHVIPPFVAAADASNPEPPRGVQNYAANLRVFSDKGVQARYDAALPALAAEEPGGASIPRTFTDGTSNTILFGTRYGTCGDGGSRYASAPDSKTAALFGQNAAKVAARVGDANATFQPHPGARQCLPTPLMAHSYSASALHVALADGSVRGVSPSLSPQTWNAAMQPNDNMPLGNDW